MTISATTPEVSYAGDNTTVAFPIPFVFDTAADLKVLSTDTDGNVAVITTGFTVSGGNRSTGTLTFGTAPAAGITITILDDPEREQATDYVSNDPFPAESHEHALDRGVRISKRLYQMILRCLRTQDGDPASGAAMVFPTVAARRGRFALWSDDSTAKLEPAVGLPVGEPLSQSIIGGLLYPQTAEESAASVIPTNYAYPPGYPQRYGGSPGGADARESIQRAVDISDRVVLTAGEWNISLDSGSIGIKLRTGSELIFDAGASVKLLPHNAATYQILQIFGADNVRVVNAVIDGNKAQNAAVAGEHGMGIDIRSSDNVRIENPSVVECWGDGIYIGPVGAGGVPSSNVHISTPYVARCRRQGISITSVRGCWITDALIEDILGTDPQAGIDIEPNVAADVIWDVYINGASIRNCTAGAGFLIQPGSAAAAGCRVFGKWISVENCRDGFQSRGAFLAGSGAGAGVLIEDFSAVNIQGCGIYVRKHRADSWPIKFVRPVIEDVNTAALTSVDGAFISLFRTSTEDAAPYDYEIGNLHIVEPTLRGSGTGYFIISGRAQGVKDVSFIDPVEMTGSTATIQELMDHAIKLGNTQNFIVSNKRLSFEPPVKITTSAAAQSATNDSLEAILLWAARFRHLWGYGGSGLTIELQSGSTLTRQVLITDGPDLGWVTITAGGGATISVQRSAVTRTLTGMGTPVFGGRACIMPIIAASFTLDSSGSTTNNRHMYALRDGARGSVVAATLTSNDGRGAWYDHGSEGLLRGATIVGSVSNIHITNGSIVRAGGTTGTSNLTDNTPAAGGLILR